MRLDEFHESLLRLQPPEGIIKVLAGENQKTIGKLINRM